MEKTKKNNKMFDFEQAVENAHVFEASVDSEDENISIEDFKFVQMDKSIHDVKFDTKPTTFGKDAFRRFVKNKSSVVAFAILSILILMAIFVPIFNTNSITTNFPAQTFLPPRWHGFENTGFMDGTREYKDIYVAKPDAEDQSTWYPAGFNVNAIVEGSVVFTDVKISGNASKYATGGSVILRTDKRDKNAGIVSKFYPFSYKNDFNLIVNLPETKNEALAPRYALVAEVKFTNDITKKIYLKEMSRDFGVIKVENIKDKVLAEKPEELAEYVTSFSTRYALELETVSEGTFPYIYVDSFEIIEFAKPNEGVAHKASWTDANEMMLRGGKDAVSEEAWSVYGSGSRAMHEAFATRAKFSYDVYESVFGVKKHVAIGEDDIRKYISNGWMEYDFLVGEESFVLTELGEKFCPLRSVDPGSQVKMNGPNGVVYEVDGDVLMYRYWGYESYPYYFFGTNHNGRDQFKVVFAGLRTSLILGLITTVICVGIGVVWGAISGYYGGTIDLVMERISDILSGIPYIVVMTLSILILGQTFAVFVLSLVLTGWIGTAARTRAQFYRYKGREFVLASRTLGASDGRLIFKHILPNAMGPIITGSVLMIPSIVFTEANISYLGLGLQGMPSLGVALSEAQKHLQQYPFLIVSAAIVVSIMMICFNLFGNGLRDAFNPSLKGVES